MDWEKIFANYLPDNRLISKKYKEHIQINSKKPNSPIKKISKGPKKMFSQRYTNDQQVYEKMFDIINYEGNAKLTLQ